ncbi:prephenate dehydratase [Xanthomonas phaseoli pv. phaseoli]|uniref:Bifunctional chorismate mutase/prephenate dehydratase n=6 Tax=Xanthomonas TaxID=338 RepID=A0AAI8ESK4_XANAC|nr:MULTISPECIES: prephenate dehydratase [Xanthomonas]OOW60264.1 prephenate dehydratase [Xanthomonas campestris pv. thespesiae]OOW62506.1 prephenate dehydratase [Xanthomonas campestris pv. centellae]OOW80258.1 prephenate dehydratase [Xanthomonas campestris pv. leeana]OOW89601.1 prephenate dehydratase [Xanthomonas campestris pv. vitiscarnosae]OOW95438.1 prephenate dehydratase [Xanthomonas campestris pv. vitistrifoliae]OOX15339.1 prephenate dehydratase [Xanthomonas campestris pv. azadirachtae]C
MAPKSNKPTAATGGNKKPTKTATSASAGKPANTPAEKAAIKTAAPVLADVRAKIDEIDRNIQALIAERANFAHQVGKAKGKLAAAVDYYRPEREAQVLRMVVDRNEGPLSDEVLVHVYREIMSACLAQQEPLKIGYLGPEGTFSQQAVLKHFGRSAVGLPMATIEEVFQEVEAGNADFGVVPVENSGQGTIQVTLDMFLTSNLKICGEVELRVHQYLLSRNGRLEDIERIYAHSQSFAQTAGWLRSHLPKVEKIAVSSNAEGARRARNAEDAAAIGGESAAHVYGLKKVIMKSIEDDDDNTTRFLVIGRQIFPSSGHDRTSVLVFIHDKPGALFDVLSPFARHGISMNRIESRPSHQAKWEYGFFIDLIGHVEDDAMKQALAELKAHSAQIKVLGSYPVAIP